MNNFTVVTLPNGTIQIKVGGVVLVEYSSNKLQVVENIFDFAAKLPRAVVPAEKPFDPFAIEEVNIADLRRVNAPATDDEDKDAQVMVDTKEEVVSPVPTASKPPVEETKPVVIVPATPAPSSDEIILDDEEEDDVVLDDEDEVVLDNKPSTQPSTETTAQPSDELEDLVTCIPVEANQDVGIADAEDAAGDQALSEGEAVDTSKSAASVAVPTETETIVVSGSMLDRTGGTNESAQAAINHKTATLMFTIEEKLKTANVVIRAALNSTWSFAAVAAVNALMSKHTENIGRLQLEVLIPEGVEFELMARTKAPKPLAMKPLSRKFGIKSKLDSNGLRVDETATTKALIELKNSVSAINAASSGDIEQTLSNMMSMSKNVTLVKVPMSKDSWPATAKATIESMEGEKVSMDLTPAKANTQVIEYKNSYIE